jgi:hypothetical protein
VAPRGPAGIWPAAKSAAWSEWFLTLLETTASFLSWLVPTLPLGRALTTATPVPVVARKSATQATIIAGDGLLRRVFILLHRLRSN